MIKFFLSILIIISYNLMFGQKSLDQADFIKDFQSKGDDAEWLVEYDMIAWWTSDSVSAQPIESRRSIGKEWFCFQSEDDVWHAVYGKYAESKYTVAFHYIVDSTWKVKRSFEVVDTAILNTHARAIITAKEKMGNIPDSIGLAMNQYIRKNPDQTLQVWIFPAFQPNSYAVYGGEYVYTISSDGTRMLKDESYFQGKFKAYLVDNNPQEIVLNYSELDYPTIGGVFYVWYYKQYFSNILLQTKYYATTAFKTERTGYTWLHVDKSEKLNVEKGGKKKKKKE